MGAYSRLDAYYIFTILSKCSSIFCNKTVITKREDVRKQGFCTIPGSSGGSLTDLLLEFFWEGVGWGGVGWALIRGWALINFFCL